VKLAVKEVLEKCKEKNIPSGFHVVDTNPEQLQEKIKDGCTFLAYGIDYFFMRDNAISGMNKIKNDIKWKFLFQHIHLGEHQRFH